MSQDAKVTITRGKISLSVEIKGVENEKKKYLGSLTGAFVSGEPKVEEGQK